MKEHIATVLSDGTQYPNVFTCAGAMALALFILIQVVRCAIERKLLNELMSPIWAPVLIVAMFGVLLGIDHIRAVGLA